MAHLASYVKTGPVSASFAYLYAPSGERLSKLDVSASETEWYMLDREDVVTDYSQIGAGSLVHEISYVQPVAVDSKVARIAASGGAEHFYVPDALGSVTHLLDTSQAIVNSEASDAWGNVVASSAALQDRYGFTQREKDSESGLMAFRARSYDPRVGRFQQRDPLSGEADYRYGNNAPTTFTDPSGKQAEGKPEEVEIGGLKVQLIGELQEGKAPATTDAFKKVTTTLKSLAGSTTIKGDFKDVPAVMEGKLKLYYGTPDLILAHIQKDAGKEKADKIRNARAARVAAGDIWPDIGLNLPDARVYLFSDAFTPSEDSLLDEFVLNHVMSDVLLDARGQHFHDEAQINMNLTTMGKYIAELAIAASTDDEKAKAFALKTFKDTLAWKNPPPEVQKRMYEQAAVDIRIKKAASQGETKARLDKVQKWLDSGAKEFAASKGKEFIEGLEK